MPNFNHHPTKRIYSPLERLTPHEQICYDINSVGCLSQNGFSASDITAALGLSPQKVIDYLQCYLRKENSRKYRF